MKPHLPRRNRHPFVISREPLNISIGLFGCVLIFGCALIIVTINLTLRAEDNAHRVTEAYQGFQDGKCKSCHPAIWREWENSMHAKAWGDEIYQAAAKQVADRETKCDQCHAPQPILITGVGKMPKLRDKQRDAGVSCLVCHLDAHGAMNGPPSKCRNLFSCQCYQSYLYRTDSALRDLSWSTKCS